MENLFNTFKVNSNNKKEVDARKLFAKQSASISYRHTHDEFIARSLRGTKAAADATEKSGQTEIQ